ncbi:MAG: dTDP-glucose 4,6-dehydratase [Bacteroidota bacterium]|nr:dTDP-glucose 4,6-dehydratase [Bacteroidota bacterium]
MSIHSKTPTRKLTNVLVTGGAGFIGSAFVRAAVGEHWFPGKVVVLDALTYAGNFENIADFADALTFIHGDICDADMVEKTISTHQIDTVVHFAAESHVDRSILGPMVFTRTNVLGTHTLLEMSRRLGVRLFLHISTDEVYGSLGEEGSFTELSPLNPTSPYAASKAAADLMVLAYARTYGFPAIVTRCSNNYGPYQFPEKLIPLMIIHALRGMELPVYGDGMNIRDWIHTRDHVGALRCILSSGREGEIYNIGGGNQRRNIDIVRAILRYLGKPESLVRFVSDRPGHDRRYAVDSAKLASELGWRPVVPFEEGLRETIEWYVRNEPWWRRVMDGEYQEYYTRQYLKR